jgi:purine-nucleoside/S-methyl-5'-thioadenosine phosphorylase / adenosine deaminase
VRPFDPSGEHLAIDLPGARALFTTRRGGVSSGPYASLNLGKLTADHSDAVQENRARLESQVGVKLAMIRQVHGATVRRLGAMCDVGGSFPEADGQATALPGVGVMVLVADCVPIALAGRGAVAMLHAGWRGLAAGIVDEGVRAVRELGASEPLVAAIGPGAGVCCYEVGEEVHAAFGERGVRAGRNLDLKAIARRALDRAGVETIYDVERCTICDEEFFSHRRDHGTTGRQAGIAWLI